MSRPLFLALLPLLAVSACAPAIATDSSTSRADTGRRCAFSDTIQGYTAEKDTLYLRAGSQVYKVETAGFCPDVDTGIALGFRASLGSSQICVGDWIEVIAPRTSLATTPCRARVTQALTTDEVKALPKKSRP
jgi:hypothetical protein